MVSDFHRAVMRPALQALSSPTAADGALRLLAAGLVRSSTSWYNYTTVTYTSSLCLDVATRHDAPAGMPAVNFVLMQHLCP